MIMLCPRICVHLKGISHPMEQFLYGSDEIYVLPVDFDHSVETLIDAKVSVKYLLYTNR